MSKWTTTAILSTRNKPFLVVEGYKYHDILSWVCLQMRCALFAGFLLRGSSVSSESEYGLSEGNRNKLVGSYSPYGDIQMDPECDHKWSLKIQGNLDSLSREILVLHRKRKNRKTKKITSWQNRFRNDWYFSKCKIHYPCTIFHI